MPADAEAPARRRPGQELGLYLATAGLAVRADGHCTGGEADAGVYDCVRISLLPHLTTQDIDSLVGVLRGCA